MRPSGRSYSATDFWRRGHPPSSGRTSNRGFIIQETAVMAPQSTRPSPPASPARHRRPAKSARLRCEQLEGRITPALFTVQSPMQFTGLNNNGCVAVADFNKDGFADAVLTNYGLAESSGDGNTITILYGRSGGGFNRVQLPTGGTNVSFASIA